MAKFGKRLASVLLAAAMAACALAGCGKDAAAKESGAQGKVDASRVYRETASPLDDVAGMLKKAFSEDAAEGATGAGSEFADAFGDSYENYSNPFVAGGRYNVLCTNGSSDMVYIVSFDEDGENGEIRHLPKSEEGWITVATGSPDGWIFSVENVYEYVNLGQEADEEGDTDSFGTSQFYIRALDPDGKEAWFKKIEAGEEFYGRSLVATEKAAYFLSEQGVHIFDRADGKQTNVDLPVDNFYGSICTDGKGDILLAGSTSDGLGVWKLDESAGKFVDQEISARDFYGDGALASGCGDYDFYMSRTDGIYGFKIGAEPEMVVDYIGSDLTISYTQGFAIASPRSALVLSYDMGEDEENGVRLLSKADPATVGERTVLTIGCTYADDELRKAVVAYNKANEKFRIRIQEYPYEETGEDEYASRLNSEIAAGNVPDMVMLSMDMPVESYAAKGLFEDLEPYFTGDEEVSRGQYLTNILDAFRVGGKMYYVTPNFNVIGLAGKKADFGDTRGVTIRQLEKMIQERKLGYDTALGLMTRDSVLNMVQYYAADQYVDWEKGDCSFDSDSFIDLLEFAKKFPKEYKDEEGIWDKAEAYMREGKQLVRDISLYDFDAYMEQRYGYIGEDMVFMGYPGKGDNGPAVQAGMMLAMSHSARDKDACWDFMRRFYLDEYQAGIEYSFPVSKKALEERGRAAMVPKTYTYTDENGKEVTEEVGQSAIYINGKEITIPRPSQEDIDAVIAILEGVESQSGMDSNISKIVTEETGAFFAGQKTAAEVADIIQSRAKVYINEVR